MEAHEAKALSSPQKAVPYPRGKGSVLPTTGSESTDENAVSYQQGGRGQQTADDDDVGDVVFLGVAAPAGFEVVHQPPGKRPAMLLCVTKAQTERSRTAGKYRRIMGRTKATAFARTGL